MNLTILKTLFLLIIGFIASFSGHTASDKLYYDEMNESHHTYLPPVHYILDFIPLSLSPPISVPEYMEMIRAGKSIVHLNIYMESAKPLPGDFWRTFPFLAHSLESFQIVYDRSLQFGKKILDNFPLDIFNSISWPKLKLISMDFGSLYVNGTDEILIDIATSNMPQLNALRLYYGKFTSLSTSVLGSTRTLPLLQKLGMRGSRLTYDSIIHLTRIRTLKSLNLSLNDIDNDKLFLLRNMSILEELNLCNNKIDDAGIIHLIPLKQLKILELFGNNITNKAILHIMFKLPELIIFDLESEIDEIEI